MTAFCFRMWLIYFLSGCDFFRSNKGLTQNAHLLDPRNRLSFPSASRPPRFSLRIPSQTWLSVWNGTDEATRPATRAPAIPTRIPHTGCCPRSAQPLALVALPLCVEGCISPCFPAVQECRSTRCGKPRICSALSRLGMYVFSWGRLSVVDCVACESQPGH